MSRTYKDAPYHVKLMRDFKKNHIVDHDHHNIGREIYRRTAVFVDGQRIDDETFNIKTSKDVDKFEKFKKFLQSHSIEYTVQKRMWFDFTDDEFVTVKPMNYGFMWEYENKCTEDLIGEMLKSKFSVDGSLENGKMAPCTPQLSTLEYKKEDYYRCHGFCSFWKYSRRSKFKSATKRMMKAHYAGISAEDLIDFNDFTEDDKSHSCWC